MRSRTHSRKWILGGGGRSSLRNGCSRRQTRAQGRSGSESSSRRRRRRRRMGREKTSRQRRTCRERSRRRHPQRWRRLGKVRDRPRMAVARCRQHAKRPPPPQAKRQLPAPLRPSDPSPRRRPRAELTGRYRPPKHKMPLRAGSSVPLPRRSVRRRHARLRRKARPSKRRGRRKARPSKRRGRRKARPSRRRGQIWPRTTWRRSTGAPRIKQGPRSEQGQMMGTTMARFGTLKSCSDCGGRTASCVT